jgi:hypothetical protein
MRHQIIVGSVEIAARPATVYGLIADPSLWHHFMAETRVSPRHAPAQLARGMTFHVWNRHGPWHWRTRAQVMQAIPQRSVVLEVTFLGRPVAAWRYDIVPIARGSRVTESTRDLRGMGMVLLCVLGTGVVDRAGRNQRNIERTLARLKSVAERPA